MQKETYKDYLESAEALLYQSIGEKVTKINTVKPFYAGLNISIKVVAKLLWKIEQMKKRKRE